MQLQGMLIKGRFENGGWRITWVTSKPTRESIPPSSSGTGCRTCCQASHDGTGSVLTSRVRSWENSWIWSIKEQGTSWPPASISTSDHHQIRHNGCIPNSVQIPHLVNSSLKSYRERGSGQHSPSLIKYKFSQMIIKTSEGRVHNYCSFRFKALKFFWSSLRTTRSGNIPAEVADNWKLPVKRDKKDLLLILNSAGQGEKKVRGEAGRMVAMSRAVMER